MSMKNAAGRKLSTLRASNEISLPEGAVKRKVQEKRTSSAKAKQPNPMNDPVGIMQAVSNLIPRG